MLLLIWIIVVLFGLAVVVDQLLSEESVRRWRESTRDLRRRMDERDLDIAITATHSLFCNLFDAIYGSRYWSRKRFVRSYYSSLLALGTVTLLLGWDTTVFLRLVNSVGTGDFGRIMVGMSLAIFVMNPGVDYLSLQETRWILGRHTNHTPAMLVLLGLVDLAATSLIFLIGFTILGISYASLTNQHFNYAALLKRDEGLVIFASTFFTSALWLGYMISALLIRIVKRNWRLFRIVLETVGESAAPARTTVGLITVVLVAMYGVTQLGIWMVGTVGGS